MNNGHNEGSQPGDGHAIPEDGLGQEFCTRRRNILYKEKCISRNT